MSIIAQTSQSSPVTIDWNNEKLFILEDSGGDYTGFWTMNDGIGNMAIKLGIDGNGYHTVNNDGASEILWGAHGGHGYLSLNAAKTGTQGAVVNYGISLIVDAEDDAIYVGNPNNSTGGTRTTGYKIANNSGALFAGAIKGTAGITDLTTFDNPSGLFVGDAGSLLDDNNGGLNVVSRSNLMFYVNESTGNSISAMFIKNSNGFVGIGTETPGNELEVNGTVRSQEVLVEATGWPDFVFHKDYGLRSLLQLEAYINQHGHLPDIPSSETVETEGQNVGEMQKLLLQKIEELTLYTIEQEKIIQSHESKNEQLQGIIEHLIQRIETLENKN